MRFVLRSKIHKAIVTEADLGYIGSITINEELIIMGFELSDSPTEPKIILID